MKNTWFSVWTLLHFFSPCFLCRPRVQNQLIRQNEKLVFRVLSPGLPCVRTFFFFLLFPLQHNTPAARLLCFFLKIFGYVVDISHRGKRSIVAGCAVHSHTHTRTQTFYASFEPRGKTGFSCLVFRRFFFLFKFCFLCFSPVVVVGSWPLFLNFSCWFAGPGVLGQASCEQSRCEGSLVGTFFSCAGFPTKI